MSDKTDSVSKSGKSETQTTSESEVDVTRLVRLVVERAEQACRYVVKHQDFSETDPAYADGFRVCAEVCKLAIADHVARHIDEDILKANVKEMAARSEGGRRKENK